MGFLLAAVAFVANSTVHWPLRAARCETETQSLLSLSSSLRLQVYNCRNVLYFVDTLAVGTPPVWPRLVVDTGSSDLVIADKGQLLSYSMQHSSTSHQVSKEPIPVVYGAGTALGVEMLDKVCIQDLCVDRQDFLLATAPQRAPLNFFDGVLGLSLPNLAANKHGFTLLQSLARVMSLRALGFRLSLGNGGTFLELGEVADLLSRSQQATGSPGFRLRIDGQLGLWLVELSGDGPRRAVLDSGTSLIGLPGQWFDTFVESVLSANPDQCFSYQGSLCCLCSASLPMELSFAFQGEDQRSFRLILGKSDLFIYAGCDFMGRPLCWLGAERSLLEGLDIVVLGQAFLRRVVPVFDVERRAVTLFPSQVPPAIFVVTSCHRSALVPAAWLFLGLAAGALLLGQFLSQSQGAGFGALFLGRSLSQSQGDGLDYLAL